MVEAECQAGSRHSGSTSIGEANTTFVSPDKQLIMIKNLSKTDVDAVWEVIIGIISASSQVDQAFFELHGFFVNKAD